MSPDHHRYLLIMFTEVKEICSPELLGHVLNAANLAQIKTVSLTPAQLPPHPASPLPQVNGNIRQTPGSRVVNDLVDIVQSAADFITLLSPGQVQGALSQG